MLADKPVARFGHAVRESNASRTLFAGCLKCIMLLTLSVLATSNAAGKAGERLKYCNGVMFGEQWNASNRRFVEQVFSAADIDIQVVDMPVARSELSFDRRVCDFHAGVRGFREKGDAIRIDVPVYWASIVVVAHRSHEGKTASMADWKHLSKEERIAYPRSFELESVFEGISPKQLVSVDSLSQGFKLLSLQRVKYFVIPKIGSSLSADHSHELLQTFVVKEIFGGELYWWTHARLRKEAESLERSLMQSNDHRLHWHLRGMR